MTIDPELAELLGKDLLTLASHYHVERDGGLGNIDILVHRVLNGPELGKYVAVPAAVRWGPSKYAGIGNTETDALKNCLKKIKGIDLAEIFSQDEPKTET
ncbi:MAG: hypothetical protein C4293_20765 [Nitrospiraceae bacterium]